MPYEMPILPKQEHRNDERCTRCRGKCCLIYKSVLAGGAYPEGQTWFEDWCTTFHESPASYGVEPHFDPLEVHRSGNEHMKDELLAKGINPDGCQYLGPTGCKIPWSKRPEHCKTYRCEEWKKDDEKSNKHK